MSDALTKIMNLPCAGFDNDGEETVNREAAAAIVQELEIRLAHAQNVAQAWEDTYTLYEGLWEASGLAPAKPILPREPHSWK